jgi:hypothetical protein
VVTVKNNQVHKKLVHPNFWEKHILNESIVILVGVGKSGLTNLANLICSMKPAYYIYGPVLLKSIPPSPPINQYLRTCIRSSLLYDYLVPMVRGMRLCEDRRNATYADMAWATCPKERLKRLARELNSLGALHYMVRNKSLFVLDMCDAIFRAEIYRQIFPSCSVLHLARNGLDVVNLRAELGWDSTSSYFYPIGPTTDYLKYKEGKPILAPWFVLDEIVDCYWDEWNMATRAAHIWRIQVEGQPIDFRYEAVMENPEETITRLIHLFPFLEETSVTPLVVSKHNGAKPLERKVTYDDIMQPELEEFKRVMNNLEYE